METGGGAKASDGIPKLYFGQSLGGRIHHLQFNHYLETTHLSGDFGQMRES